MPGLRGRLQAAEAPRRENSPLVLTAKAHARLWSDGLLHGADRLIICTLTLRPWLWFGFSWACVHRTVCFPIASFTFLF